MEEIQAKRNVISVSLRDKTALHANYMPFIRGGGLYAITEQRFNLGDEVILSVKIDAMGKKFAVPGRVVWMSPEQSQGQGVGVQFTGRTKDNIRKALETLLGDLAKKPSIYHTY